MANKRFEVDQGFKLGNNVTIDEATGDISTTGNIHIAGLGGLTFSENLKLAIAQGGTGASTQQAAIDALVGPQMSGYYLRSNGTSVSMSALSPTDLSGAVAIVKGGTGQTSQQAAINALVGTQTSGYYLRSDGTNVTMSNLRASDLTGALTSPTIQSATVKGEKAAVLSLGTLSTGTTTVDLTQAQIFTATISSAAAVTFAFTNAPGVDLAQMIMLRLTNAGSGTITWPAGTKFANGIAPTLTSNGVDMLGVFYDSVTSSYVIFLLGKDIK